MLVLDKKQLFKAPQARQELMRRLFGGLPQKGDANCGTFLIKIKMKDVYQKIVSDHSAASMLFITPRNRNIFCSLS